MSKYLLILPLSFLGLKFLIPTYLFLSDLQFIYFILLLSLGVIVFRKNIKILALIAVTAGSYFAYTYLSLGTPTVLVEKIEGDSQDKYRTIFTLNSNQRFANINSDIKLVNHSIDSKFIIRGNQKYLYLFHKEKDKFRSLFVIPTQPFNETRDFIVYVLAGLMNDPNFMMSASKIVGKWPDNSHRAYPFYKLGYKYMKRFKNSKSLEDKEISLRYLNYGLKFKSRNNLQLISKIKVCLKLLQKYSTKYQVQSS